LPGVQQAGQVVHHRPHENIHLSLVGALITDLPAGYSLEQSTLFHDRPRSIIA